MTSQKYIQSLIDDIDGILPKAEARLPWSKPGDVAAQRRVLERVRSYLVSEQQDFVATSESQPASTTPEQQEVVQQIVQAVTQEMDTIRTTLMQPLQVDIEALRQHRESLVQEIRHLERKKLQLDSITHQKTNEQQIIAEFSQGLINRCTESLRQQLAQLMANLEVRLANRESNEGIAPATSSQLQVGSVMHSQEHLEQLKELQVHSDRLLTNLDANQRAIFDALQRNLQGYQESLSQGLEKMHRLGVQGEMLFTALVNRLAQQLGREASTLLQSSRQRADSAGQTNEAATRQATPETLLPTNAFKVTDPSASGAAQLTPHYNPMPGTQTPLQPVFSIERLPTEPASAPSSTEAQGAISKANGLPLVPQGDEQRTPLADTRSQTLQAQFQPTPKDSLLDNLNSDDWEIIEGIDLENLDLESDEPDIETFIQLDIDSQGSLPFVEEIMTSSPSGTQQLDFLSDSLNEKWKEIAPSPEQTAAGEVAGLDQLNEAAQPNSRSDSRRQEIDELYESLFGTNSLTGQALPDESDLKADAGSGASEQMKDPTDFQRLWDEQFSNPDSVNPLSSQVEDVLFEGLTDPAAEPTEAQPLDSSEGHLAKYWEALFVEDSGAGSPIETGLAAEAQVSSRLDHSLLNDESAIEQEGVKTIATLTDLFEEMGLSHSLSVAEADSPPPTTKERGENQTSNPNPQASWVEDSYIPASPNENLLFTNELESELDGKILLDQNTLQKLSEDLNNFEGSGDQHFQRHEEQRSLGNDLESQLVAPEADLANQENLPFPIWEELLAEDWEEFRLNYGSEQASTPQSLEIGATTDLPVQEPVQFDIDEAKSATGSAQEKMVDNSTPTAPESVESDFDPDLFPSEILRDLDLEDTISVQPGEEENSNSVNVRRGDRSDEPAAPEQLEGQVSAQAAPGRELEVAKSGALDLHRHGDLNLFEDEALIEMLWDEQIYSATEELITSPESEFDSDFFLQEAPDSQFDGTLTPDEEALSENLQEKSFEGAQDTTLPSQSLDNKSNSDSQKALDFKQEDKLAPDQETSNKHQLSDSLTQEIQTSERSNFDMDFLQPDPLTPNQPDNLKNKNGNSDKEANR